MTKSTTNKSTSFSEIGFNIGFNIVASIIILGVLALLLTGLNFFISSAPTPDSVIQVIERAGGENINVEDGTSAIGTCATDSYQTAYEFTATKGGELFNGVVCVGFNVQPQILDGAINQFSH